MRALHSAVAVSAVLACASPGTAQQLSLGDALRMAEDSNPRYRGAQTGIAEAGARVRESRGAFLPALSARISLMGNSNRRWVGTDPYGNPLPAEEAIETRSSYGANALSLSVPLYAPGRLGELRAARAGARGAAAFAQLEATRLRAEVARRYLEAVRLDRILSLETRFLESSRERLGANRRLFEIAAQSLAEVLGAEVEVARQEQAVELARGEVHKAKLALGEVMGVRLPTSAELTTAPTPGADPGAAEADSVVAVALRDHPWLAQQRETLAEAGHRSGTARRGRWPVVSASADLNRSTFGQDLQGFSVLNPSSQADRTLSVGLSVGVPLFDQFRSSSRVASARANQVRAYEGVRAAELQVEREVHAALIDVWNARRAVGLAGRAAQLSRERLDLAREQYRVGAIRFTELQAVVDRTAEVEREAINAQFALAFAQVTLAEKRGASLPAREE